MSVPIPESMKSFADPSKVGKGAWYLLYLMASEIKTIEDREHVKYAVECLRKRFHCLKCRRHFDKLCQTHPLLKVLYADDPKEIFSWIYDANTEANGHAGKGIQPFQDFKTFFYEDVVCDHDCGGPQTPPQVNRPLVVNRPVIGNQTQSNTSIWSPINHSPSDGSNVITVKPSSVPHFTIRPTGQTLPIPPPAMRPMSPRRRISMVPAGQLATIPILNTSFTNASGTRFISHY
jgi:hypothetical protein